LTSRPPKRFESICREWLHRLTDALDQCAATHSVVLIDGRGPCSAWIARAAERRGLPCLAIELAPPRLTLTQWQRRCALSIDQSSRQLRLWVGPTESDSKTDPSETGRDLNGGADRRSIDAISRAGSRADQALLGLADRAVVLHVRPAGNMYGLLSSVCRAGGPTSERITVDFGPEELAAANLIGQGLAGRWFPQPAWTAPLDPTLPDPPAEATRPTRVVNAAEAWPTLAEWMSAHADDWPYLVHCTRAREGPWPDQSNDEYLDEVLDGRPAVPRSPLATLQRIIQQRRLRASGRWVRGGQPVVSFSAAPLDALLAQRIYRRHLRRWDYEPFGLGIRRSRLTALGASPVRYGGPAAKSDDRRFAADRWLEQPARSRDGRRDWRHEQEWRIAGDVDLEPLDANDGWIFVPDARSAVAIRQIIDDWPIIVCQPSALGRAVDGERSPRGRTNARP
jgi:hypothetical protein